MRYCPVCQERFDEEVIKFCTKDGTPLLEENNAPNFVILPSEEAQAAQHEVGEETVIRRKTEGGSQFDPDRIVVPTGQQVRSSRQVYYPPPEPPNTAKVIALTIVGTLVVLSFGAGLFWLFQKEPATMINVNTNPVNLNANLNSNVGFNSNFNFNLNTNYNANANYNPNYNFNFNFNAPMSKTPTNTPTPKQSPTPSPSPLGPSPSPSPRTAPNTNSQPPRMMQSRPSASNRMTGNSN